MEESTFGNNALDADHGAYELREQFPWSDTARNKRAFKSYENLLPLLQILSVDFVSYFRGGIAERLHVLTWIPKNPVLLKRRNRKKFVKNIDFNFSLLKRKRERF